MNLSFLFLFLSAFLFVEQSLGKVISNETASEVTKNILTSEESSTEAIKSENLRDKVIEKLTTLSDEPLKLGIKIMQEAYADKPENEFVNTFLAKVLSDYQELRAEKPVRKIEIFLAYNVIFEFISGTGPMNDTSKFRNRYIAIQEALAKYDVKTVSNEFQKKFEEFLNWLTPEIEMHIHQNKLGLEGQRLANEFKELCLQFKEETNIHEKMRIHTTLLRMLEE